MNKTQAQVSHVLKSLARKEEWKHRLQQSEELHDILLKAANRYVAGEKRSDGFAIARKLQAKGYGISLENIGENTKLLAQCREAKMEFDQLIEDVGAIAPGQTVSFDLSHIGLSYQFDTAYGHLIELAEKANEHEVTLMISMEESTKTDQILAVYRQAAELYSNIGITLQAHLFRTPDDLRKLVQLPGKIRIVKGAYQEPSHLAMERSDYLNNRYLELVDHLVSTNHTVSVATHDQKLLEEMERRQFLQSTDVEIEMLYGIQPSQLKLFKEKGYQTRVYLTYGHEWFLYLCHRLAEYPENIYTALIDIINPSLPKVDDMY
ncbi:proline dehydrogenase family protein [Halalkalibacterium halodurans]|uniref:proline dehydrogenase family protein n=1 Tax=Halalkalibacterium halodurans TaxID=86665 RepID=UPI002E236049|nr:proline dehydrogenase family protein [Halalkalibacterium halodurans]